MIEKLGHTKRMQTIRKEWIREGKPRGTLEGLESSQQKAEGRGRSSGAAQNHSSTMAPFEKARSPVHTNVVDEEDHAAYAAAPRPAKEDDKAKCTDTSKDSLFIPDDEEETLGDEPPDDDLDALLAEDETRSAKMVAFSPRKAPPTSQMEDNFDDDMEAMAGLDDIW